MILGMKTPTAIKLSLWVLFTSALSLMFYPEWLDTDFLEMGITPARILAVLVFGVWYMLLKLKGKS